MSRYADVDKLICSLKEQSKYENNQRIITTWADALKSFVNILEDAKTEDVAPVVHGKWIVQEKPVYISSAEHPLSKPTKLYIPDFYTCSMCGRREPYQEPYCHCGAKMDEKEKEDT